MPNLRKIATALFVASLAGLAIGPRPSIAQAVTASDIDAFVFMTRENPPGDAPGSLIDTFADDIVIEPGRQARIGTFAPSFSSALSVNTNSFGEILVDNFDNEGELELQILATVPRNAGPVRCISSAGNSCVRWEQFFTTVRISAPSLPGGVSFEARDCLASQDNPLFFGIQDAFTDPEIAVLRPLVGSNVIGCAATLSWAPEDADAGFYGLRIDVDLMPVRIVYTETSAVWSPQFPTPGVQLPINVSVSAARVDGIELTQAIQVLQGVEQFKAAARVGALPIAQVADKPLAIRFYPAPSQRRRMVTARLTLYDPLTNSGYVDVIENVTLSPACTPAERRLRSTLPSGGRCQSIDFEVPRPPDGSFVGHLVLEGGRGNVITYETFDIPIDEASDRLVVKAVRVCLDTDPDTGLGLDCGDAAARRLKEQFATLRQIAPTGDVKIFRTHNRIRGRSIVLFVGSDDEDPELCFDDMLNVVAIGSLSATSCTPKSWWDWVLLELSTLYKYADGYGNNPAEEVTVYFGVAPAFAASDVQGSGVRIGKRLVTGVAGSFSDIVHPRFANANLGRDAAAHEVGHAVGLRHNPTEQPRTAEPPGCYALSDPDSWDGAWTFSDNRLRTLDSDEPQVGYDTQRRIAIDGRTNFDFMGYCTPAWISPFNYNRLQNEIGNLLPGTTPGRFMLVSGFVGEDGVDLMPIFTGDTEGETGTGEGDLAIRLLSESGQELLVRRTDPVVPSALSFSGEDVSATPFFVEVIPENPQAARLEIIDADGNVAARRDLTGSPPEVTIQSPAGGGSLVGVQTISWSASDPDGDLLTYRVQYSNDGGVSWQNLAQNTLRTSLAVDFAELPGANGQGVVRVLASDGALTGSAVSNAFSVPAHLPEAEIVAPEAGREYHVAQMVLLSGSAFDYEDTTGDMLQIGWQSNLDGFLGIGDELALEGLSAGQHELTFVVIDGDGNQATDTVNVSVVEEFPPEEIVTNDQDDDGFPADVDCNDDDVDVFPGAPEIGNNGIDEDCDGADFVLVDRLDNDLDGFSPVAGDCDDGNATIYRYAPELPGDGIDSDCSGSDLRLCDANGDDSIDIADIRAILAARNQPTDELDARDGDRDGYITVLDGRACLLRCDQPQCASP